MKKLLLVCVLLGVVVAVYASRLLITRRNTLSIKTEPIGLDLSSKIIFLTERSYSVQKYLVKDEPKPGFPKIGLLIDSMIFKIPVKFIDYNNPTWNADCNDRPLLEKKTISGWQTVDRDSCINKNTAGSYVNLSSGMIFPFSLLLGKVDGAKVIPVNLTGTYRVRWDLAYECQSELIGEKGSGNVRYFNCKKAVSYSPEFKIVP